MPGLGDPSCEPAAKKRSREKSTKSDTEAGSTFSPNNDHATPGTFTEMPISPPTGAKGSAKPVLKRSAKPQQQIKPGIIRVSSLQQTSMQEVTGNDMEGASETSDSDNQADHFGCNDDDGQLEHYGKHDISKKLPIMTVRY